MASKNYPVTYEITPDGGDSIIQTLLINPDTMLSTCEVENPPEWTQLSYKQCSQCSLSGTAHCPIALRLVEPIAKLRHLTSFDRVHVTVHTPERKYQHDVDAQEALRSLFGLIMATSGCPSMKPFRYMARYHLPFSIEEETLQRILASSLVEHLLDNADQTISLKEVKERIKNFYNTILLLNEAMAARLKHPEYAESAVNAVVIFTAHSTLIPLMLDKEIDKIRNFFKS